MALFSKSIEAAQNAVTKAESTVAEWEAKAAAARAEAVRIDSEAGAAILADESAAERITLQVHSWERKARAFDQAAEEARRKLHTARREVLDVEASELEKRAEKIRKDAEKQEAAVEALKAKLEELDGGQWERGQYVGDDGVEDEKAKHTGKSGQLLWESLLATTQAQCIRYWLAKGERPQNLHQLNAEFGPTHEAWATVLGSDYLHKYGDPITASLREAIDAGPSFVGA